MHNGIAPVFLVYYNVIYAYTAITTATAVRRRRPIEILSRIFLLVHLI